MDTLGNERPPLPAAKDRATKKVKLRGDLGDSTGYRNCLVNEAVMESSMEEVFEIPEVVLNEGDIAIDKSRSFPVIQIFKGLKDKLCNNLGKAVIVSLLGTTIGYKALCSRLQSMWDISQARILDIRRGFFLVQFSNDANYTKALCEGPLVINGAYLLVQKWTPDLRVSNGTVTSTIVWICLPELPLQYYSVKVLSAIAAAIGPVVKIDCNTSELHHGRFARVVVTINLNEPLVSMLHIDNGNQKVEYENLIDICFACGRIGHSDFHCPHKSSTDSGANQCGVDLDSNSGESFGHFRAWMVVEKRKRNVRGSNSSLGKNISSNKQGSCFAILDEINDDFQGDIPANKEKVPFNNNIPNSSDFDQENSHFSPHVVKALLKSKK